MHRILMASSTIAFAFLAVSGAASAIEQDKTSIEGRMSVELLTGCVKVQVFLKNTTDVKISVVTGYGGRPRSIVPTLSYGGRMLTPENWGGFPRESMRPDVIVLNPKEESL